MYVMFCQRKCLV